MNSMIADWAKAAAAFTPTSRPHFQPDADLSESPKNFFSAVPVLLREEFFQHALVFDRSSLTRWRQRMGKEKPRAMLQWRPGRKR